MKRNIFLTSVVTGLCLVPLTGCFNISSLNAHSHVESYTYTEDYAALYADELRQIFGDYSVSGPTECHIAPEDCSCGYHQDEVTYYQWTITYTDCYGQTMDCVMENRNPFYLQQLRWLEEQLADHIYTQYMSEFYDNDLEDQASYCFCFIGNFCNSVSSEDERSRYRFDTTNAYKEALEQQEDIIPLSSASYADLISGYPMVFSLHLVMDPASGMSEDEFDSVSYDMAGALVAEIGDGLNVQVNTLDRDRSYMNGFCILRGEICDDLDQDFRAAAFESYAGEFW